MTIQIDDKIAEALQSQARARGVTLDEYLRSMVAMPSTGSGEEWARDFDEALDELFAGDARPLPGTGSTYSREDIYADHD